MSWAPGGTWGQNAFLNPSSYDFSLGRVTPGDTGITVTFSQGFSDRLKKTGGNMSGPLTLAAPSAGDLDAVSKSYVDTVATGVQNFSSSVLFLTGGALTGFLTLNADPQQPLEAVTKQYADTRDAAVLSTATAQANTVAGSAAAAAAVAQATANAALPLIGGTLTGPLTLSGAPASGLQPATKNYVDAAVAGGAAGLAVLKAGDNMTGPLVLPADPTLALQATTKQYVDGKVSALGSPPTIIQTFKQVGYTAGSGPQVLCTIPVNGLYRISYYVLVTGGPGSGGTLSLSLSWLDGIGSQVFTTPDVPNGAGNKANGHVVAAAGTPSQIGWAVNLSGISPGNTQYEVLLSAERLI